MAMDLGGAKGGLKADINVTPLVDVMLVLLIIMMLVAPMLQKGVDVRLPQAANTEDKPETAGADSPGDHGGLTVLRQFRGGLGPRVAQPRAGALDLTVERIVLLKGDEDAPYSRDHAT